jgi:hypothetical protein
VFGPLTNLSKLLLQNNNLTALDFTTLLTLPKLNSVNLCMNPGVFPSCSDWPGLKKILLVNGSAVPVSYPCPVSSTTRSTTPALKTTTSNSGCGCNCTTLAKLQQKMNDIVATTNSLFSSCSSSTTTAIKTTTPSTSTCSPSPAACLAHYWPIANSSVTDTITCKNATSVSPRFASDRFGVANQAIWVNSAATAWSLPADFYYQGDTTTTMWVMKVDFQGTPHCNNNIYGSILLFSFSMSNRNIGPS